MIYFLSAGILLGLSAGFAPGPLLALVISETLHHGPRSGLKVALAPIITDFPIIVLTVFILAKLSDFNILLGLISFLGGAVVFYLGVESLRTVAVSVDTKTTHSKSLRKGILVNAASPHPYLFWLSIGAPTMIKAAQQHIFIAVLFVSCFYIFLVGSKILLAIVVGKTRIFLSSSAYIYIMKCLGILLLVFAVFLFRDSLKFFIGS
ncbi:MAG: LysE family transporter [Deltaproteobacteria bacterium]|nr:LysE family transporter [Deltaproteobacteria bacterium]